ncbi:hypothetical protein CEXT_597231 [Caerostris extrusa]|uniref:Secreted protein n=1 Tax=Caerostris extrusa TaxID=172846 RepID=A0AAV4Q9Q2_CAEEX|nr:hypothetical protein CEXT_597231 [Caerostris extrusa]
MGLCSQVATFLCISLVSCLCHFGQKTHTGFKSFLSNFVRLPTNQFFFLFCLSSLNCPPLEVEHPQEVLCSVPVSDPCICSHFLVFAK